jgi:hypothetical protein
MDYVTQVIEYIDSLTGKEITNDIIEDIKNHRKQYLEFLESKSLIHLLDVIQPKTNLQWEYTYKLLTPLYAFDTYISQNRQMEAFNQIKDKQTTRNMCDYDNKYITKYRSM